MAARIAPLALALLLAGCATAQTAPPVASAAPPGAAAADDSPHGRLHRLFHESDEANLRRNPISGHLPRRPSLCRPARRLLHRRERRRREGRRRAGAGGARRDRPRLAQRDRPARLRRLQIYPRERPARPSAGPAGADLGPADQPFLRRPHLLPGLRLRAERGAVQHDARLRQQSQAPPPVRRGARPGDRPLPPRHGLGRGRHQAHHPQRHRPARHAAARRARGLALLRAGAELPGRGAGGGPGAAARRISRGRSPTASSRPTGGCAISFRTNICRAPATASASSTCRAATGSTRG